jgi:hypothetical protein
MKEYFKEYAENISHSLRNLDSILKFTNNTALIGQYTEKIVIDFIEKSISPLNTCTGGVISPELYNKEKLPQIDVIFFDSNPLPPAFQIDDFGLVPQKSVFGLIEIKRTDYGKGLDNLNVKLPKLNNLIADLPSGNKPKSLGVICIIENHDLSGTNKLTNLLETSNCLYLIDKSEDKLIINHEGIYELINYIIECKNYHKNNISHTSINISNL